MIKKLTMTDGWYGTKKNNMTQSLYFCLLFFRLKIKETIGNQ